MRQLILLALPGLIALGVAACGQPDSTLNPAQAGLSRLGDGEDSGCPGCLLREAIESAEAGDKIEVPAGTYTLSDGELVFDKDLTLAGAGPEQTIIQAAETAETAANRVLRIHEGSNVTISGVTIRHGMATSQEERMVIFPILPGGIVSINQEFGGGISNDGTLQLVNVTVSGNHAGSGGGIFNGGTLTITGGKIAGNRANVMGGGIFNGGVMAITGCVFDGNQARTGGGINNWADLTMAGSTLRANSTELGGGGIFNASVGTSVLDSSTISGNFARSGGGIQNDGHLTLTNITVSGNTAKFGGGVQNWNNLQATNTTVSGNRAESRGGGISVREPTAPPNTRVTNTIVAENTAATGSDCFGDFTSLGNNLLGDGGGCAFAAASGDLIGTRAQPVAPRLAPLGNNGGLTETLALLRAARPSTRGGAVRRRTRTNGASPVPRARRTTSAPSSGIINRFWQPLQVG